MKNFNTNDELRDISTVSHDEWHHIESLIKNKIENEFLNITKLDPDKIRSYGEAGVIADINKKLRFLLQRKNCLFTKVSKKYAIASAKEIEWDSLISSRRK